RTQKIYYKIRIKNIGEVELTKNIKVPANLSVDDKVNKECILNRYDKNIKSGEIVELTGEIPWKAVKGKHELKAVFDVKNRIFEENEDNNESKSIKIDVKDVEINIKEGEKFEIKISKSEKLEYNLTGYQVKEDQIQWSKEDEEKSFIEIDSNGIIKANKKGEEVVYVKIKDTDILKTIKIIVKERLAVIIVPGYLGSELYLNNKIVWPPDSISNFSENKNLTGIIDIRKDLQVIGCNSDGKSKKNIKVSSKDDYGTNDTYKTLIEYIKNHENYKKNFDNIYFCSWDWRDLNLGVKQLDKLINSAKEEKIYIITHSTGGLVCSKYMSETENERVSKFIAVASPFYGTPQIFEVMEEGKLDSFYKPVNIVEALTYNFTVRGVLKDLLNNFKSSYQLLPGENYFKNSKYYLYGNSFETPLNYKKTENYLKSEHNKNLYTKNYEFQTDIDTDIYEEEYFYNIIGCSESTIGKFSDDSKEFDSLEKKKYIDGDGAIPVISSSLNGKTPKDRTYYVYDNDKNRELHGQLMWDKSVLNLIVNILVDKTDSFDKSVIKRKYQK
ncbi:MAG: CARDB domain-containing protein, partial [Clostridiales bacterium]